MKDVPMAEQMIINMDKGRIRKKVLLYEAEAKERKAVTDKIAAKGFTERVKGFMRQFGLEKK